jgi:hypothetical protein
MSEPKTCAFFRSLALTCAHYRSLSNPFMCKEMQQSVHLLYGKDVSKLEE